MAAFIHIRLLFRWMCHRTKFYDNSGEVTETVRWHIIQEVHPRDADLPVAGVFQLGRVLA